LELGEAKGGGGLTGAGGNSEKKGKKGKVKKKSSPRHKQKSYQQLPRGAASLSEGEAGVLWRKEEKVRKREGG